MPHRHSVLLTGGTGILGNELASWVGERGHIALRLVSRRPPPALVPPHEEWRQLDLLNDLLEPALHGMRAVIHLASSKTATDQDERACRRLLAAAQAAGVAHFVVISIIGCDRIPLPFYDTKLAIEAAVRASPVPSSIVRVSQFHSFVARLIELSAASPMPTPFIHDLCFQPVDEREVAQQLLAIALGEPLGNAPEIAGPELLRLSEIAATWFALTGGADRLVPVSVAALGEAAGASSAAARPVLEGYRQAWNTPQGARTLGRVTFAEWLKRRLVTSSG